MWIYRHSSIILNDHKQAQTDFWKWTNIFEFWKGFVFAYNSQGSKKLWMIIIFIHRLLKYKVVHVSKQNNKF